MPSYGSISRPERKDCLQSGTNINPTPKRGEGIYPKRPGRNFDKTKQKEATMKDFHEAVLALTVSADMGNVYKKAIEAENSPFRENWNGNHVHVRVDKAKDVPGFGDEILVISLISHTLSNLKETVNWYERTGAKVISTNYKGVNQNG